MKTVEEVLALSTAYLEQRGIAAARYQAEEVLSDGLRVKRMDLYMDFRRPLLEDELIRCRQLLGRRGRREPMQYIRGEVEFFDCQFNVDSRVLIPRHETEILVDKISKEITQPEGKTLWDVCCGSGCIGISLKKRFPELTVVLSDLSDDALSVAESNAKLNDVDVDLRQGDLLEPFKGQQADYIVCNPPYITSAEYAALEPEVKLYEPRDALLAGDDGLDFYRRLAAQMPDHLRHPGRAWLEIGCAQGEALTHLFTTETWDRVECGKDWSDHDRFFSLEIL